ncbi:uncharacterized protein LOC144579504 [Callithrix jacchus]
MHSFLQRKLKNLHGEARAGLVTPRPPPLLVQPTGGLSSEAGSRVHRARTGGGEFARGAGGSPGAGKGRTGGWGPGSAGPGSGASESQRRRHPSVGSNAAPWDLLEAAAGRRETLRTSLRVGASLQKDFVGFDHINCVTTTCIFSGTTMAHLPCLRWGQLIYQAFRLKLKYQLFLGLQPASFLTGIYTISIPGIQAFRLGWKLHNNFLRSSLQTADLETFQPAQTCFYTRKVKTQEKQQQQQTRLCMKTSGSFKQVSKKLKIIQMSIKIKTNKYTMEYLHNRSYTPQF